MDDTTEAMTEVETTPEVETQEVETTAEQTEDTNTESTAEQTTPAESVGDESVETAPPPDEPILTVKFNKQLRALSHEDATNYAQKGMKYDAVSPLLDTLKYVAASEGKNLTEFVEAIREQNENNLMYRLVERFGDEEAAREFLEVEKSKHKAAYENLIAKEKNEEAETDEAVTKRVADDFANFQKEFPQFTEFGKVPKNVVKDSVKNGVPLLDAYLRYEHRERVRAENAKAAQAAASKASTGPQQSDGAQTVSPTMAAMMKGLWG